MNVYWKQIPGARHRELGIIKFLCWEAFSRRYLLSYIQLVSVQQSLQFIGHWFLVFLLLLFCSTLNLV